jgi:hypothetical protein
MSTGGNTRELSNAGTHAAPITAIWKWIGSKRERWRGCREAASEIVASAEHEGYLDGECAAGHAASHWETRSERW